MAAEFAARQAEEQRVAEEQARLARESEVAAQQPAVASALEVNTGGYTRDAKGRWHRPNGQFASKAEITDAGLSWEMFKYV